MLAGLLFLTVALPWLQPWAPPPSPATPGLLTAWGMTGLLWLGTREPKYPAPASTTILLLCGSLLAITAWSLAWMPFTDRALIGGLWGSVACIFLASQVGQRPQWVRALAQSLLWVALICAAMGWAQYAGWATTPSEGWDWLHASPQRDAYANLRQRNQFGTLMALGLACWLSLYSSDWKPKNATQSLQLVLLCVGAVISCSRAGAISWLLLAGLAAVRHIGSAGKTRPLAWRAPAIAIGLFVLLSLILPAVPPTAPADLPPAPAPALARATTQMEGLDICESRLVLWRNVLELSLQRPWTGWGWGELDYAMATQDLTGMRFCGIVAHAHNLPLQLAVEWGWPVALGLMALAMWWLWRRRPVGPISASALLGWGLFIPLGVHSLLEFPLWYGPFQMTLGLALGMLSQDKGSSPTSPAPRLATALAVALSLGAVWGAWDYLRVSQLYVPAHQRIGSARVEPMAQAEHSFWFHNAVDFARLMSPDTPAHLQSRLAERLVHYSPEPSVFKHQPQSSPTSPHASPATSRP
jgi:hypothetical protein